MLYPRTNPFRQRYDLSGFWDFRTDPDDVGLGSRWSRGFADGRPIAVPASWNDQLADERDFLGPAWYQTRFDAPWGGGGDRRARVRFGSVNYHAEVWLNGERLGEHEGGHLPFELDATEVLRAEANLLVVRVDGQLAPDRVPPGNLPPGRDGFALRQHPNASFDFFPYCGLHRPVVLCGLPAEGIEHIRVETELGDGRARVRVRLERSGDGPATARFELRDGADPVDAARIDCAGACEVELAVSDPRLWSPGSPHLYDLRVELARGGETFDRYDLIIGLRSVAVDGDSLVLNGRPVLLRGFGRHEDFPVWGRGFAPPVIVKDYELMRWVGANSFRTSHYPYSEEMLQLADRLGFLVVDETPAVGLFFAEEGLERRRALCARFVTDMIERDRNHPSVIMWSLANEPHSRRPEAKEFFRELYDLANALDGSRPVTVVSMVGEHEEAFEFCDVVSINRYRGWYTESARIDDGCAALERELDSLHERFRKPVFVSEFGADATPGWHAQPPEMFSEEYQAELIARYVELMDRRPWIVGQHVWNLCDFKTGQGIHRVGALNYKGVFTRDRRPKLAAHRLRELWT